MFIDQWTVNARTPSGVPCEHVAPTERDDLIYFRSINMLLLRSKKRAATAMICS